MTRSLNFTLRRSKDTSMSQKNAANASLHPQLHQGHASGRAPCPSRRTFLAVAAGTVVAALSATPMSLLPRVHAAESESVERSAAFLRVSTFVTGKHDLNKETSERFLASLSRHDPTFGSKAETLLAHIDNAKFVDMDAFLAATPADSLLLETATHIVSAWYLGIVGDAADAELITYADALMYRPTRGILAVPTYGPGPLAWGDKPGTA
jgi:fructose 5-dehydrogenase small subunit